MIYSGFNNRLFIFDASKSYHKIDKITKGTRYLLGIGIRFNNNSLCFKNEKKHIYIPVENVKEIYCFNEVSINSKLLDFLAQKNIIVHFFNYYV